MGAVFNELFGGLQVGSLIYWMVVIFGGCFFLFMCGLFGFCGVKIKRLYDRTKGYNVLYWKHPDNTPGGVDCIDLLKIYLDEDEFVTDYFNKMGWPYRKKQYEKKGKLELYETRMANVKKAYTEQRKVYVDGAPDWDYKETWWQLWRVNVKWVYEEKQSSDTYKLTPYNPDKIIQLYISKGYSDLTSNELAQDLRGSQDWETLYKRHLKWLQTLAMGAPVVLGVAFVFGIIILGVFLIGETGGA